MIFSQWEKPVTLGLTPVPLLKWKTARPWKGHQNPTFGKDRNFPSSTVNFRVYVKLWGGNKTHPPLFRTYFVYNYRESLPSNDHISHQTEKENHQKWLGKRGCDRSQEDIVQTTTRQSNNLHSLIIVTNAGRNLIGTYFENISGIPAYRNPWSIFFTLRILEMSFLVSKTPFFGGPWSVTFGGSGISSGFRLWSRKAASIQCQPGCPGVWSKWIFVTKTLRF